VALIPGRFYRLALSAQRGHLEVQLNGQKQIEAEDSTYPEAGRVGLWTGNDTVAEFDEVRADPL
jgi:hypothetical protein